MRSSSIASWDKEITGKLAAIAAADRTRMVGFAVALNGEVVAVDQFDSPSLFAALSPKILRSYITEAIDNPVRLDAPVVTPELVRSFLAEPELVAAPAEKVFDTDDSETVHRKSDKMGDTTVRKKGAPSTSKPLYESAQKKRAPAKDDDARDSGDESGAQVSRRPPRARAAARARARCASARRRARTRRAPRRGGRAWRAGRRARSAAGGSSRAPARAVSASTSARPAAGPNAIATATARLSSTTGDGASSRERVVERGDARPVGVRRRSRARAWQAAIAACSAYGPRAPPSASARVERREPAADQQLIPARAVLIEQQDRLARRADARRATRDAWISISATRPWTSGSSRRELGEDAAEAQRVLAQRRAHPVVAGGRRVALVEDEVDDLEHRRQPRRELGAARHLERHLRPRRASAWRARCAARSSARGRGTRARSRRSSGRRAGAASARRAPRSTAPDGRR